GQFSLQRDRSTNGDRKPHEAPDRCAAPPLDPRRHTSDEVRRNPNLLPDLLELRERHSLTRSPLTRGVGRRSERGLLELGGRLENRGGLLIAISTLCHRFL